MSLLVSVIRMSKTTLRFRRWPSCLSVTLCGSLTVASCNHPAAPATDGIHVIAGLADSILAPGTTLNIRVVARNVAAATRTLVGSTGCVAFRDVRNPAGELISAGDGRICFSDLRHYRLAPGDSLVDNLTWTAATSTALPLAPGAYELRVGVLSSEAGQVRSLPYALRIK